MLQTGKRVCSVESVNYYLNPNTSKFVTIASGLYGMQEYAPDHLAQGCAVAKPIFLEVQSVASDCMRSIPNISDVSPKTHSNDLVRAANLVSHWTTIKDICRF